MNISSRYKLKSNLHLAISFKFIARIPNCFTKGYKDLVELVNYISNFHRLSELC